MSSSVKTIYRHTKKQQVEYEAVLRKISILESKIVELQKQIDKLNA